MIEQNASESYLASFYGMDNLYPQELGDVWKPVNTSPSGGQLVVDDIVNLTVDQQFDELNKLVCGGSTDANASNGAGKFTDFEDPLGYPRMVDTLVSKKIVQGKQDPKLYQFLVSSKEFQPQQYLTQVHQDSSVNDLVRSLKYLEKNIESQTTELRQVIDQNYLKFADCKKSIDDLLVEFKKTKTQAQRERDNTKVFNPTRNRKRQSALVQGTGTTLATNPSSSDSVSLSADLDEGLKNLITTTDLMIKPIIDHKNKEVKLNKLIEFINANKFFFDLPSRMIEYLKTHNHEQLIEEYHRYLKKRIELDAENANLKSNGSSADLDTLLANTALIKTFKEVENIIDEYRKKTYKELLTIDHEASSGRSMFRNANNAKFISLVDKLYQLNPSSVSGGSTENPIYEFLTLQLDGLKKELKYQLEKFERKFSMMQRKLLDYLNSLKSYREGGSNISYISEKYSGVEDFLKSSSITSTSATGSKGSGIDDSLILEIFDTNDNLDISIINETWLVLFNFISYLDDSFMKKMIKFINNYIHYNTQGNNSFPPIDADGSIRESYIKFMVSVTNKLVNIFNDPNNQPTTNLIESSPKNYSSFVPNHSNSLSTIYYLSNISRCINHVLTKIGKSINSIGKGSDTNAIVKNLRNSSSTINQRIIEAVCAVWVNDCSQFYDLESWEMQKQTGLGEGVSYTKTVSIMESYESYVLTKVARLVFMRDDQGKSYDERDEIIPDGIPGESVRIVSAHPSKRILVSIEIQFMRSLKVLIDSILKRYSIEKENSEFGLYKVLTMNNFDELSRLTYPKLIAKFDKVFSNNLGDQNLKLYADIDKASLTILEDILIREKKLVDELVTKHFTQTIYLTSKSKDICVDGFVYNVLVHFVKLVHTIKPLTGGDIFITIINELQTYFLKIIIENMRNVPHDEHYLPMIGNLRLSVNFFVEVFAQSNALNLNEYCIKLVEIIFGEIDEAGNPSYSEREFDLVLARNLKESENEFDSLY
ncbi:exocyst complex component Sec5p [[Candida] railenensis]|uniref:Exocyst complex component SEC5 n=1 Tax=[Candida] railenensis TaxID=45579 RepID=A0A9P0VVZ6_9ASCO|nr:exocyst complex component Sec5p [[Candida] railenensis]